MRWPISDRDPWHRWFAWHPVTIDNTRVWLEWIERQILMPELGGAFYYRWPASAIEAASAGETRSGSTEGESATAEGRDAPTPTVHP